MRNPPEPIKAAFFGGRGFDSHYGGVENATREITRRLAAQPDLAVTVYGFGGQRWFRATRQQGIDIGSVDAPAWASRWLGNAGASLVNLLFAMFKDRPDVVVLFASGPSMLCWLTRLLGVPSIACLRAIDSNRSKWGWFNRLILRTGEHAAVHVASCCTVNSLEMQQHYQQQAASDRTIHFIPNGAGFPDQGSDDVLDEIGVTPGGYLLFAARLDPSKRPDLLINAFQALPDSLKIPLVIAGGNYPNPAYRRMIEGLDHRQVIFTGHLQRQRLDPLMRNCRIFVLPSVLEGMSNSLLSAMAAGRCVICSDIPPNRALVDDDPEVLFRRDDQQDLTRALQQALSRPEQCQRVGQRLQQVAKNRYSWEQSAAAFARLIREQAD
jgi:glycosyltransferase involved in cell wall biosynthesis